MINQIPLACFLSMIRPPGVQFDNALLQIAPVDKTKCPLVRDSSDVTFQLYTRYNPTSFQELVIDDDEKLLASHMNFHDQTVIFFHAFMEMPADGSGVLVREAYMLRGDVNMIMVDASQLEAGPWYFTAADNTWYIGRFAAKLIDFLVTRGLDLSKTHIIGHSLGAQAAGVAGAFIASGRVSRITGLDPALPLFAKLPLEQRLDPSDAHFVDVIHTDAGIFGVNFPSGHADFYPNGGISPQPGCELEVVLHQPQFFNKFFCSHWRSYMFYAESVLRPEGFVASPCESWRGYKVGACARGKPAHMGFAAEPTRCSGFVGSPCESWRGYKVGACARGKAAHMGFAGDSSMKPRGFYTFELQPVNRENQPIGTFKYKKHTGRQEFDSDIHDIRTHSQESNSDKHNMRIHSQESESIQNNMRNHFKYHKKTKEHQHDMEEDPTYNKMNAKYSTLSTESRQDKPMYDVVLNSDSIQNNMRKHLHHDKNGDDKYGVIKDSRYMKTYSTLPTEKINLDTMYDVKYSDSTSEEMDSSLDLTAAEADLETTLARIKLRNTADKIQEKKLKKTDTSKIKKSLLESFPTEYSNLKESYSISDITADSTPQKNSHVKKRQKRFLGFFQKSDATENDNFLFRILEFVNKNRRNIIPVFTVMREINTLVKSANGELNHSTKERNNYIGHNPPILPIANYNLELGSDSKAKAFVKRLLGLKVEGDRLSITGK